MALAKTIVLFADGFTRKNLRRHNGIYNLWGAEFEWSKIVRSSNGLLFHGLNSKLKVRYLSHDLNNKLIVCYSDHRVFD